MYAGPTRNSLAYTTGHHGLYLWTDVWKMDNLFGIMVRRKTRLKACVRVKTISNWVGEQRHLPFSPIAPPKRNGV